ncbi:hypothetical protein EEAAV_26600 (plasmid) [Rahnella aceris]
MGSPKLLFSEPEIMDAEQLIQSENLNNLALIERFVLYYRDQQLGFKVSVPDGTNGDWAIETFLVSKERSYHTYIQALHSGWHHFVQAGEYKRLVCGSEVVMSNTVMEYVTNMDFIVRARGQVLVNGLGLGTILHPLLSKHAVESVTVIEFNQEVIDLVAPSFLHDPRVSIVKGDAYTYPVEYYDFVWHDIWSDIDPANLALMENLEQRYEGHCGWQGSWTKELLQNPRYYLSELYSSFFNRRPR